jgi:anti-anti-sigma factor
MLRDTINQQIAAGKRNFAIDLSLLDYIYSDTINVLMGLNKRVLEVSGRLSLLAPQPEALQVLKRAGISNILRIFDTEADLLKTSEDIILQTTSFKVSDLQALANEKPQSEFDQLRSEIGSVFGGQDTPSMDRGMSAPKAAPQPPRPVAPQPPANVSPSVSDEFDQAFQQFEGFDNDQGGFAQGQQPAQSSYTPPVQSPRGNVPSFRQPPAPSAPMQSPQFQGRQYVPPSPAPQTTRFDAVPKAPARPGYVPPEPPKAMPDNMSRTETQRFQAAPGATSRPGVKMDQMSPLSGPIQDETLEDFPSAKKSKPKFEESDSLDSDDEFDNITKKKSPVGIIVAIVVIVLLGSIGAYIVLNQMNSKEAKTVATKTSVPSVPAVSQVPVETSTPKVTDSSAITATAPAAVTPPAQQEKTPEPVAVSEPKPTPKSVSKSRSKQRAASASSYSESSTPRVPPAQKAAPSKVVFTSVPSGASLEINGEIVGTTPYTWTKPVFGMVNVTARKSGYQENSVTFEYTGGTSNQSISLEKEYTPPPPPPVTSTPKTYTPVETPPPPPPAYEEPEPALPPPPPVTQPVATSSGDASIFIASIPPVADVYLDGKLIGKTNVSELKLPSGTHVLKFVKGAKEVTKEVTVQSGKNPSQMVRLP